jgi:hypothetical protein
MALARLTLAVYHDLGRCAVYRQGFEACASFRVTFQLFGAGRFVFPKLLALLKHPVAMTVAPLVAS